MKSLIFALMFLTSSSFASSKASVQEAIQLLSSLAERSDSFKVQPSRDLKSMIAEAALVHYNAESVEDFEQSWVGNSSSVWGADEMNWGIDTVDGAAGYVGRVLSDNLEDQGGEEAAEENYKKNIAKANKAFQILRKIKTIKYGVGPIGAVQCGVTFAGLLIIDTVSGDVHEVIMEGSGC